MDLMARMMMGGAFGYLAGAIMPSFAEAAAVTVVFCIGAGIAGAKS